MQILASSVCFKLPRIPHGWGLSQRAKQWAPESCDKVKIHCPDVLSPTCLVLRLSGLNRSSALWSCLWLQVYRMCFTDIFFIILLALLHLLGQNNTSIIFLNRFPYKTLWLVRTGETQVSLTKITAPCVTQSERLPCSSGTCITAPAPKSWQWSQWSWWWHSGLSWGLSVLLCLCLQGTACRSWGSDFKGTSQSNNKDQNIQQVQTGIYKTPRIITFKRCGSIFSFVLWAQFRLCRHCIHNLIHILRVLSLYANYVWYNLHCTNST